jgi:hypothetical protein
MSGFPGKPQVYRWKAFSPGFTALQGTCRTVNPGRLDFYSNQRFEENQLPG